MQQRVCWQIPAITQMDPDRFNTQWPSASELGPEDPLQFFWWLGDSGTGSGTGRHRPAQAPVPGGKLLMEQGNGASFVAAHRKILVYQWASVSNTKARKLSNSSTGIGLVAVDQTRKR